MGGINMENTIIASFWRNNSIALILHKYTLNSVLLHNQSHAAQFS